MGGLRVEGAGGFVAKQDRRAAGQGAGDANTLLLSTRELRWVLIGLIHQADPFQQLVHPVTNLGAGINAREFHGEGNVVRHRFRGQQIKVLEYHAHLATEGP